ncbi:YbaK/EbsC family protein [Fodinicola feengrottensis]|uniref:YbaK/EbsC family protein n=1 Tax=Fodinicola feengrottensis TaxID=435914 RepID=A0ABN2HSN2_9ACTN
MSSHDHPNVQKIAAALAEAGAPGQIKILPEAVHTAALAAAALGIEVGQIANSLVFDADGQPLLVLTSGAHRVDTAAVAEKLGVQKIKRASADFVRQHTGQVIGGVAPLGHPAPIRTLVDADLRQYDQVWAAAGVPQSVFPTTFDELVALTGGMPAQVASPNT